MATGYSIILDDSVTLYAFTFDPEWVANAAENGAIDSVELHLNASGVIREDTAADIAARAIVLSELVSTQVAPVHVEITLNGSTQWDFPVNSTIGSPIITRFKLLSQEDGSGESYWKWELGVYAKTSGRGDGTSNLDTSLETVKVNGQVVRKVWRAEAKASSAQAAEGVVRGFQPADDKLKEDMQLFYQQSRAVGTWIWDARKKGAIIDISETVEITGLGAGYDFDRQVNEAGTAPAILQRRARSGVTTIIKGTIRSLVNVIDIPGPHFSESDTLVRDFEAESTWPEAIPDGEEGLKLGVYRRDYMEVWKSTGDPGEPNHGDHAHSTLLDPPGDGAVSSGV